MKLRSVLENLGMRVIDNSSRSNLYILKVMDTAELDPHGIYEASSRVAGAKLISIQENTPCASIMRY